MTDQVNEAVQYRKKPVVIEAMLFDGTRESAGNVCRWANVGDEPRITYCTSSNRPGEAFDMVIWTLEGDMTASPGDWIIKGVKGEFYPCKPDIFAATYEPAAHPSRGVVDEVIATLDEIGGLTRALRHGGPAPEDLQGLSDALTEATNMAHEAMHALQAAALPAVPEGYVLVRRDSIERAAQMAEVFDDGSDGADAETAARVAHDLRGWLIAATPAHDQPEGER